MLPQVNAQLLEVQHAAGVTGGESYDGPQAPGPGDMKWQGSADAYLKERRDRLRDARGEVRAMIRELVVATDDPEIDWRSGDVVTFRRDEDTASTSVAVKTVERRELAGIASPTTRLTLEDQ